MAYLGLPWISKEIAAWLRHQQYIETIFTRVFLYWAPPTHLIWPPPGDVIPDVQPEAASPAVCAVNQVGRQASWGHVWVFLLRSYDELLTDQSSRINGDIQLLCCGKTTRIFHAALALSPHCLYRRNATPSLTVWLKRNYPLYSYLSVIMLCAGERSQNKGGVCRGWVQLPADMCRPGLQRKHRWKWF